MIIPANEGTANSVLDKISELVNDDGIVNVRMHPSATSNLLRDLQTYFDQTRQQSASTSSVSFTPTAGELRSH
jgi:hypothetical protein